MAMNRGEWSEFYAILALLENPNMNLIELGELLKKPIGKSGVNYRLKKIIELAKDC